MSRNAWLLGAALALLTIVGLARSHREVGYVRDEGIYFEASRRYAAWFVALGREPGRAMQAKVRDRAFGFNHEHPPLMKLLGGLSGRMLAEPPVQGTVDPQDPTAGGGVIAAMPEGAAMRLPAQILAGAGVLLLFAFGYRRGGPWTGVLAAGAFVLLPRVWFHAGLHAFDVPVAVAGLAVALTYRRALGDRRYGLALGPLLGVAIVVKHNALFLAPLLALHYWVTLALARFRDGRGIRRPQLLPLPLVSMAVGAPLTAWALWPWLWHHPWDRLVAYLEFHRQHNWYNTEFLGVNFNQPPMPVSYPAVMTWATVPTVLLLLGALGIALAIRTDFGPRVPPPSGTEPPRPRFAVPLPTGWNGHDGLLLLGLAAFPLLLISSPSTPIFGGTKHWITAYPFLAMGAAVAWSSLWRIADLGPRIRVLAPSALLLVLGPAAIATIDGHPYGLSQYAPLVGGPRGAADLGLVRGFWGHAVRPLLPVIDEALPEGGPVYLHDLHEAARRQYEREGAWPPDLQPSSPGRARAGLLFHEKHMLTDEVELWNGMGTTAPASIVTLDDVPLTSLYLEDR